MFLICTIWGYLVSQCFLIVVCNGLFLIPFGLSMAFHIVDHSLLNTPPSFTPFLIFSVLLLLAFIVFYSLCGLLFLDPPLNVGLGLLLIIHAVTEGPHGSRNHLYCYMAHSLQVIYTAHIYFVFIICKTHFRHIKFLLSLNLHSIGRDNQ